MEKLMDEIAHIGYSFQNNGKDADNDGVLFEGIHNHNDD